SYDKINTYIHKNKVYDLVHNMQEYEEQLVALIENLQSKGASDEYIKIALTNKGHPRFYVKFVMENLYELFN
ncbi:MAG: hypothetical protein ACOCP8_09385, partial [archaeon]